MSIQEIDSFGIFMESAVELSLKETSPLITHNNLFIIYRYTYTLLQNIKDQPFMGDA